MENDQYKVFIEIYCKGGDIRLKAPVTIEQINEFEIDNKVSLPKQYREWLTFSDGGDLFLPAGVQLYGVAHKPVIEARDDCRPNDTYCVIGTLCNGDPILCEKGKETISIYNKEAGIIEEDETYNSFDDFLMDLKAILGIED